jgi:MOSC domain-containing protein YiiM
VKRFLQSGRSGFYLSVLEEGQAAAGDSVERITRDEHGVTVADIVNLYKADKTNQDLLRRASELPELASFLARLLSRAPLGGRPDGRSSREANYESSTQQSRRI